MNMPFMMILSIVTLVMDVMARIFLGEYVIIDLIIIQVVKVLIEYLYFFLLLLFITFLVPLGCLDCNDSQLISDNGTIYLVVPCEKSHLYFLMMYLLSICKMAHFFSIYVYRNLLMHLWLPTALGIIYLFQWDAVFLKKVAYSVYDLYRVVQNYWTL